MEVGRPENLQDGEPLQSALLDAAAVVLGVSLLPGLFWAAVAKFGPAISLEQCLSMKLKSCSDPAERAAMLLLWVYPFLLGGAMVIGLACALGSRLFHLHVGAKLAALLGAVLVWGTVLAVTTPGLLKWE